MAAPNTARYLLDSLARLRETAAARSIDRTALARPTFSGVAMFTVQIEHAVRDFDGWKEAFDRDPAGRERSGVTRYRIFRPIDDPHFVSIDLDFKTQHAAEAFVTAMQTIWPRVEGTVIAKPRVRIVDCVERHEY